MLKSKFSCTILLVLFLTTSGAYAAPVTWTFSGVIDQEGVFSTFSIGDDWTFVMTFDSDQVGVGRAGDIVYSGAATFDSVAASYSASDISAEIGISNARKFLTVSIGGADAIMPSIEFTNFPGEFKSPESIFVALTLEGVVSYDILDYIALDTVPIDSSYAIVRTTSAVPPTGSLSNIAVSTVPVPAALWLFGSALAGLGWMRRKKTA